MTDYSHTKSRVLQYIGIILILAVFAGAYWYFQVFAGYKTNVSPTGSLTSGLVGYWTFDGADTTSTTATDRGSEGNNGTLNNSPTVTQGKVGQALSFDGINDSVTTAKSNTDYAAGTISWWQKPSTAYNSGVTRAIWGQSNNGTIPEFSAQVYSNNQWMVGWSKSADDDRVIISASATNYAQGEWNYYTFTWASGGYSILYQNGTEIGRNSGNTTTSNIGSNFWKIGRQGDIVGTYFTGAIDEVRFYNRVLAAGEIESLYKLGQSDEVNTGASQAQGTGRLDSGLAGYWPLDDGSGTSATDSSTNGNTGTLTNGPTWTTGQIGSAVTFDGTNDYITAGSGSGLTMTSKLSASAWVYLSALPSNGDIWNIVHKKSSGDSNYLYSFGIENNGGNYKLAYIPGGGGSTNRSNTLSISTGQWYHFAVTFDQPTLNFYVNGALNSTQSITVPGGFASGSGTMYLGGVGSTSNTINGRLDEVRVYSRPLSADEISQLYRLNTPTSTDTGLKGYWSFNGNDLSGTNAYDRSGASNTGTLTNGPTVTPGKLGQALSFDGTNDYVGVAGGGGLNNLQTGTISLWVKWSGTQTVGYGSLYGPVLSRQLNASFSNQMIGLNGSNPATAKIVWRPYAAEVTNNVLTSKNAPGDGVWNHVVITYTSGSHKLYVNGNEDVTASNTGTMSDNSSIPLTIGAWITNGGTSYAVSSIDEVRVYNRVLSAAEIQAQYAAGQSDEVNTGASQAQGTGRLDSGLAGYWKLDDGSGTSATDSSTNGNTGTLTNGPAWTTGQIGGALDFDGSSSYVTMGDPASLEGFSQLTLSVWVKPDVIAAQKAVIGKEDVYKIDINSNGTVRFLTGNNWGGAVLTTTTVLSINQWYHVVATYDGTTKYVYINGVRDGSSVATSGSLGTNSRAFMIGARDAGVDFVNAVIDEARVYNRALSAEEVSQLYRLTTPTGTDTGLKGYWSFNGKDISGITAADRSGAGNTGTLTNGPTVTPGKIGQALSFDGTDDYVSVTSVASLRPSLPFSFSFWIKPRTVSTNQGFFGSREAIQHDGYWAGSGSDGSISISYGDGTGCASDGRRTKTSPAATLVAGQWQHIVGTLRGATDMTIYVNGVDVGGTYSGTGGGISYIHASLLRLGGHGGGGGCAVSYLNGAMDEVRLYNRELTTAEITSLYNSSR